MALVVKNLPAKMQKTQETHVSVPGLGKNPLEQGMGRNSLQYSCLENSMDRGAWRQTVGL